MTPSIWPVTPDFAAEVGDIDISAPLSDEQLEIVQDAFNTYSVLVFPGQKLTQQQHVDFATLFGPLEQSIGRHRKDAKQRLRTDLADVSNLTADNRIQGANNNQRLFSIGNKLWHTDSSFKFAPARASLLYARSIPPTGGHTQFADMRAAWDALDDGTKSEIEDLVAEHCIRYSRARIGYDSFDENEVANMPAVPQKLVWTHVGSGRKGLYLASHMGKIHGMDDAAGNALIDRLIEHATQRQFVYTHRWRENDLVIWDNRCTMHRGTDFDDMRFPRDVQRATVTDEINSCERAGLPVKDRELVARSS